MNEKYFQLLSAFHSFKIRKGKAVAIYFMCIDRAIHNPIIEIGFLGVSAMQVFLNVQFLK